MKEKVNACFTETFLSDFQWGPFDLEEEEVSEEEGGEEYIPEHGASSLDEETSWRDNGAKETWRDNMLLITVTTR